jgi:hypothetical protein
VTQKKSPDARPARRKDRTPVRKKSAAAFAFTSTLEKSDNRLWGCHVRVPARIADAFEGNGPRRVICRLNNEIEYQCAILPFRKGIPVVAINKPTREKLGLSIGMEVDVELRHDETTYGLPVPEEFAEILKQEREGKRLFHALPPGKQRTLLYIVGSVKDPDKRASRAIIIVRHLRTRNGKLDYRALHAELRNPLS